MERNSERNEFSSEREVDDVLSSARPRPAPQGDRKEEVYAELRTAWLDDISATRRKRRFVVSGLAASIVAATILSLQLNSGFQNAIAAPEATLARSVGNGTVLNNLPVRKQIPVNSPLRFETGDELTTGSDAAVAIEWSTSGSLRLSADSSIIFDGGNRLTLVAGTMYFDSRSYGATLSSNIVVDTPIGLIHHVGTQFVASVGLSGVTVAVREGQVSFGDDGNTVIIQSGRSAQISNASGVELHDIGATGDTWAWASQIAPPLDIDGRSTRDIIDWLSRETGRSVEYVDAAAESYAVSDTIRGIGEVGPVRAMSIVPLATKLRLDIDNDTIRVGLKDR